MTDDEKADILHRLIAMQQTIRTLVEHAEEQGQLADAAGAKGLAFSIFMLRESLAVYASEMNKYILEYVEGTGELT